MGKSKKSKSKVIQAASSSDDDGVDDPTMPSAEPIKSTEDVGDTFDDLMTSSNKTQKKKAVLDSESDEEPLVKSSSKKYSVDSSDDDVPINFADTDSVDKDEAKSSGQNPSRSPSVDSRVSISSLDDSRLIDSRLDDSRLDDSRLSRASNPEDSRLRRSSSRSVSPSMGEKRDPTSSVKKGGGTKRGPTSSVKKSGGKRVRREKSPQSLNLELEESQEEESPLKKSSLEESPLKKSSGGKRKLVVDSDTD